MPRPSRTRHILKWIGVGLSVFTLVGWIIISLGYRATAVPTNDSAIIADQGVVCLAFAREIRSELALRSGIEPSDFPYDITAYRSPTYGSRLLHVGGKNVGMLISVPFWMLLLLTALPTAWLWHRDRRLISASPNHLRCSGCGYDLTGNLSGVCPECGEKLTTVGKAPSR